MRRTYLDQIDRAVTLARRAAASPRFAEPGALTRLLYHHWFLGRPLCPAPLATRVPAQRGVVAPWRAWGGGWDPTERGEGLVRVYLACAPHTSLHAVTAATAHAQAWGVPWRLTSRSVGQAVARPDATVLYVPADALPALHRPLTRMVEELRPFLAGGLPALTLPVGHGAALAQNPPGGGRYGEHRCGLVAATVLAHPGVSHREALTRTLGAFHDAGIDPLRPYRALDATWDQEPRHVAA